eukprot:3773160-Rhodomonas_salina.1
MQLEAAVTSGSSAYGTSENCAALPCIVSFTAANSSVIFATVPEDATMQKIETAPPIANPNPIIRADADDA